MTKKKLIPTGILASVMLLQGALPVMAGGPGKEPQGVDVKAMNTQADPRKDFYEFANGAWLKANPVPASEGRWGAFNELADKNNQLLKTILEQAAAAKAPAGSVKQKIGTFYGQGMDSVRRDANGITPMQAYFAEIDQLKTTDDVVRHMARMQKRGLGAAFDVSVYQDLKNSSAYAIYISQGGLGLPDRDYYLKTDEASARIRMEYTHHVRNMMKLVNMDEKAANQVVNTTMMIERDLALNSMSNVELRDPEKQYNLFTLEQLKSTMSNINWDMYFKEVGFTKVDKVIVGQPAFFSFLNNSMRRLTIDQWKDYLRWQLVNHSADMLSSGLEKQNFAFYGTVITGAKEMKPRWKRMVNATNNSLGELVAQAYVEQAFSPESKQRVNEMVDNLIKAFEIRLKQLDWMSPETKEKALVKLASFNRKLGYPDKWEDYSALTISDDNYMANVVRCNEFAFNKMISKLGKPIDKSEWEMLPQQVNAYYTPLLNEVVFPAAIMQPPFFNPNADEAVNYGGIGAVIGHELLHGFDDEGSKFDPSGNLNNWWSEEDLKKFEEKTERLAKQFSSYQVMDSVYINGKLTLGENIADLGGLTIAYEALQIYYQTHPRTKIDGYTPEQRFYIGWAQVWRTNQTPQYLRNQVMTDPHSPGKYRVLGPLSNLQSFYDAFNIKPGDAMYRDAASRVVIW